MLKSEQNRFLFCFNVFFSFISRDSKRNSQTQLRIPSSTNELIQFRWIRWTRRGVTARVSICLSKFNRKASELAENLISLSGLFAWCAFPCLANIQRQLFAQKSFTKQKFRNGLVSKQRSASTQGTQHWGPAEFEHNSQGWNEVLKSKYGAIGYKLIGNEVFFHLLTLSIKFPSLKNQSSDWNFSLN